MSGLRSMMGWALGAALVVGCATATPDDGDAGPDFAFGEMGMPGGEDMGGKAPECGPGDRRECEVVPGCTGLQICIGESFGPCGGVTELCNGLDDDCDGMSDEDFAGVGQACAAGRGACMAAGENVCAENGRGVVCGAVAGEPGVEVCNGDDDDCDGPSDEGADCPGEELDCADGVDDDGDGPADCRDDDCAADPACAGPREDCATPGDEDGDGQSDCDDLDCEDEPACRAPLVEVCDVPGDEDEDGAADCDDPDCEGFVDCVPPPVELCDEPADEDGDGRFNCNDEDCVGHPSCPPPPDEVCDQPGDEDGDGRFDCNDADCADHPSCQAPPPEDCATPGDEDRDGRFDCNDPDCAGHPACRALPEQCGVAGDEDGDGLADCADPDCARDPACLPPVVEPVPIADRGGQITLRGSLGAEDRTWTRPGLDCAANAAGGQRYELFRIRNDTGSWQGLALQSDWDQRGVLYVFGDGLNPAAPAGCLAANRPPAGFVNSVIEPVLIGPGEILTVVATTFDAGVALGDYAIEVFTFGGVAPLAAPGGAIGFVGSITDALPTWERLSEACAADSDEAHFYASAIVVNPAAVARTVRVDVTWEGGDGYVHVFRYAPGWQIEDTASCVAGDDDFGGIAASQIPAVVIGPREARVIVASTFFPGQAIGDYSVTVTTAP
ncbi:MAG: hypothetical protein R3F65_26935 [bacterium]